MKHNNYMPFVAGIIVSVIFGFSFMFTKNSLDIMSPIQILAFRFTLAAFILSILKFFKVIKINLRGKIKVTLLLLALFQPILYFVFETIGVNLTSSSESGMMIALIPVFVTIFAMIFLHERPSIIQLVFIAISVIGVVFIILVKGLSSSNINYLGFMALLGAVLSAAIYNILSRKLSINYKPIELTYIMMWVGAIVFLGSAILQGVYKGNLLYVFKPIFNINALIPILYLGILSSVGAFFMMNYMISKIPVSQLSVFSNLTTVISILAGVFIKGEAFYWFQAAGGIMIILGVWGTNYYGIKKFKDGI